MKNHSYISMQQDTPDQGQLQVTVWDGVNNRPVENARVRISYTGMPDNIIEEIRTDSSGKTPLLDLAAPPLEYSMKPVEQQPYSEYTVQISADGFEPKKWQEQKYFLIQSLGRVHLSGGSREMGRIISGSLSGRTPCLESIRLKIRKQRLSR